MDRRVHLFRTKPKDQTLTDIVREMHSELEQGSPDGVDDRRTSDRRACVGPVLILPLGEGDEPKPRDRRDGVVVDISDGGMRILSRVKLGPDRIVQLTLMGPRGGDHTVRCEVLRRRRLPSGYWELGLRFVGTV